MNAELITKATSAVTAATGSILGQIVDIAPILLAVAGFSIVTGLVIRALKVKR